MILPSPLSMTTGAKPARAFAPAKINLFLHVLGKRSDGYHDLESLVVFVDVGDELTASPAKDWSLEIDGPFAGELDADAANNLVLKAARAATGKPHAFHLTKNLPVASGIGGGSADAAAALRLVAPENERVYGLAANLGADVPMCLARTSAWVKRVGWPLVQAVLPPLHMVLANAGTAVSTAEIFNSWIPPVNPRVPVQQNAAFASFEELAALLVTCENDLEPLARALVPEIGLVLAALQATDDCRLARMSGSGGSCFGLYASEADAKAAAAQIKSHNKDWWVVATETVDPDPTDQWVRLMQNATMS